MKWDIDKALLSMEPSSCSGTLLQRVTLDVKLLTSATQAYREQYGADYIKPTAEELTSGFVKAWCLSIGFSNEPKASFYDRTIRGAYLQARRAISDGNLDAKTPWGRQAFQPPRKSRKK